MAISKGGERGESGTRPRRTRDDDNGFDDDGEEVGPLTKFGERVLRYSEDTVYVAIAALLVVGALVLLVDAAAELGGVLDGPDGAVLALLDRLLLVFVLVELIFAVRMTLRRREIVAEPFLIVGIIASIKEIILLSVEVGNILEGKPTTESHAGLNEFALHIGLLGVLVLVLAGCAVLLRLKERQPVEGARNEEHSSRQDE